MIQRPIGQLYFPLPVFACSGSQLVTQYTFSGTRYHTKSTTYDDNRPAPVQACCHRHGKKKQQLLQQAILKTEVCTDNAPPCILKAMAKGDSKSKPPMIVDRPASHANESPRGIVTAKDSATDVDVKPMDSSDCSDHMDEQEDKGVNRTVSKNLVSERKRRKKLNEGLYTLRALVPRISKMDKASIIGDAIDYVRELQKEVEDLQTAISEVEASRTGGNLSTEESTLNAQISENNMVTEDFEKTSRNSTPRSTDDTTTEQKILKLDVARMEEKSYHLRIFCTKGPGVFVQLMRSLEALGMEVLSANLTSFEENILNTFIAEIRDLEAMKTEEVKAAILDVAARFGLQT